MYRILIAIFVLFVLSGCNNQSDPTAGIATKQTSPKGTEYYYRSIPDSQYVGFQVNFPSDWGYTSDRNVLVPYIATQLMLVGGSAEYPPEKVPALFAEMDAEGNIAANVENVTGTLTMPKDKVKETVKIANSILTKPVFNENWMNRVIDKTYADQTAANEQLFQKLSQVTHYMHFGDTPIRNMHSVSNPQDFKSITVDQIKQWHSQTIKTDGMMVAVSGAISKADAGEAIDALLEGLPRGEKAKTFTAPQTKRPPLVLLHIPDAPKSILFISAPLPAFDKIENEFLDFIFMQKLGVGGNSLLFDSIRTKMRATYEFGAMNIYWPFNARDLAMVGEVENGKIAQVRQAALETYEQLYKSGLGADFDAIKKQFLNDANARRDEPFTSNESLTGSIIAGYKLDEFNKLPSLIESLNDAMLKKRVEAVFPKSDGFVTIAVSPDANALPGACVIKAPVEVLNCP
jgi:zinc protease